MEKRWIKTKEKILGKSYELSLVMADNKLMKKLNSHYREKNKTTNVLSFPLDKKLGEIFINKGLAKKEAQKGNVPFSKYLDHLFVHSLLHLKGFNHGEKMEAEEKKFWPIKNK
jgi:probable rRNA maturation factor